MEEVIRGYFDACNTGDADAVATFFAPGAVHYFPPDMYEGPFRGGDTIGAKWSWAVRTLGSRWTVDQIICDPDTDRAVIEWTHEKTNGGVVHSTAMHLVGRLAETEPAMKPVLERIGGIASDRDELWQQMLRRQLTERDYWAQRAAEFGAAVGESWDTRAMMQRLYELP